MNLQGNIERGWVSRYESRQHNPLHATEALHMTRFNKKNGHQEINPGGRILWIKGFLNTSINNTPVFVSEVVNFKKSWNLFQPRIDSVGHKVARHEGEICELLL